MKLLFIVLLIVFIEDHHVLKIITAILCIYSNTASTLTPSIQHRKFYTRLTLFIIIEFKERVYTIMLIKMAIWRSNKSDVRFASSLVATVNYFQFNYCVYVAVKQTEKL